jgi:tetratricopeptide (TPR) repeat protein
MAIADDRAPSDAAAPTSFGAGRYRVVRELGRGGQKVVYLVHDGTLHRDCALSLIKAEELRPEDVTRLRHEAQALARMGAQPNLVTVFDLGDDRGRPFVVCEYVAGGDLADELSRAAGPLSIERTVEIARDLLRALQCVHERGVVHRDLKPRNVWLADDGSPKLGDFGLALADDQSRLSLEGAIAGTPAYAAPEQLEGRAVDGRADLYGLGCLIYELCAGRPPFIGTLPSIVSQHLHAEPRPPSVFNPSVGPALERFILRLLAKSPDERPASAKVALAELTRPASAPGERARTSTRPLRFVVLALLVLAAGLAGLLIARRAPPPPSLRRVVVLATREPGGAVDPVTAWALASRLVEEVDHYREFRPVSSAGVLAARMTLLGQQAAIPDEMGASAIARRLSADTVAALAIAGASDGEVTVALHVFSTDDPASGAASPRERIRAAELDGDAPARLGGKLAQALARHWRLPALSDEAAGQALPRVPFDAYRTFTQAAQYFYIGRYDQAERLAREAIAAAPDNALFHATLGCALSFQSGRETEADAEVARAAALADRLTSRRSRLIVEQDRMWLAAEQARRRGDHAAKQKLVARLIAVGDELIHTFADPVGYLNNAAAQQYFLADIPRARATYAEARRAAPSLYPAYSEEAKLVCGDGKSESASREAARILWTYITCYPDSEMTPIARSDAHSLGLPQPAGELPCPARSN